MRLFFVIRQLNFGGAQRQLITLANGLTRRGHSVAIALYYRGGEMENLLDPEIKRFYLDKRNRLDLSGPFFFLLKAVRDFKPDILHGYLPTSNLLVLFIKFFNYRIPVIWGKRDSLPNYESYDPFEKLIFNLEPVFSHFVNLVIFNSQKAMQMALKKGYPSTTARVIGNGIDTDFFNIDIAAGQQMRSAWGGSEIKKLIGIVGRFHPEKDHATFLQAVAILLGKDHDVNFVCVGSGEMAYEEQLKDLAHDLGLQDNLLWVGAQTDMRAVFNALDIVISSSFSESFPNVLLEAMSCGVPCVATDVGDSARVVADMGIVVSPRNPQALATGIEEMLSRLDHINHEQLRAYIIENFSVKTLVQRTEDAFLELLAE